MPPPPGFGSTLEPVARFFQSPAGLIATVIVLVLLTILLYGSELSRFATRLLLVFLAPLINEEKRIDHRMRQQIEANEEKLNATEQAFREFTTTVAEYGQHLSSHNRAIQGLSEASQELRRGNAAQNRIMEDLIKKTEERLASKEALLAALKHRKPVLPEPPTQVPKPSPVKPLPSYRDLHPSTPLPRAKRPDHALDNPVSEKTNLVEAMMLPYYRAFDKLDLEQNTTEEKKPSPGSEVSSTEAKKAVESIMVPLYRTLYRPEKGKYLPDAGKKDEAAATPPDRKPHRQIPPGCARQRHPLKPW